MRQISLLNVLPLALILLGASACAGHGEAGHAQRDQTQERLADLERAFGQQSIRLERIEDKLDLLYDKVETNRLSLESRHLSEKIYSSPAPAPPASRVEEPDYSIPELTVESLKPAKHEKVEPQRGEDAQDTVIQITEEEYNRFVYGSNAPPSGASPERRPSSPNPGPGRSRSPYPSVTDERLTPGAGSVPPQEAEIIKNVDLYKKGLSLYRDGSYQEAIQYFNNYLNSSPEKDYLDNVYYWIGECHYGLGRYSDAIHQFMKVLSDTPSGNKVPDSMLKAALAYFQMGNRAEAKSMIETLIDKYPNTNAAKIAADKARSLSL